MIEIEGDIWEFYENYDAWVVITTNGSVRKDGRAVMGRGVAEQAARRLPTLQVELGEALRHYGNKCFLFLDHRIVTLPVKHRWQDRADLALIEQGIKWIAECWHSSLPLFLVRPGCGNGWLTWEQVKPVLAKHLDDRFVVVESPKGKA